MVEPFNIRKLKATEQRYAALETAARRDALDTVRAEWFSAERAGPNPKEEAQAAASMADDLRIAAEQLTRARRERLRELYASEMAQWQRELAAKGLAISNA